MKIKTLAAVIAGLYSSAVLAVDPFVIKDIRVEGVQRTEAGTVFNYLPVKVGDTFDDDKAKASIKALFATGFFRDVKLSAEGSTLIVNVQERPTIYSVSVNGSKEFDKDQLLKALKDNGLAESRIFDRSLLEQAEQELKRQYYSRGKYSVEIKSTVTPLERNRVGISFDISEGLAAKIHQINIVGNKEFSESELLGQFSQKVGGWFAFFTKSDQYSKQKLSADLEVLRSYYLNRGFLEFTIDSTQVAISPDKKNIYITINLNEGERYTVADVKLAGDMLVPEEDLRKLIKVKPGDVFSREVVNESSQAISERLGNDGYAFANVNAIPELNKEKRTVVFTYFVDPGRRVYVRNVNVTGNTKTKDEVIRREVRQMEDGWYSGSKIKRSKERLDVLGYFGDVTVETPQVAETPDQVDLNVNVTEKQTGNISVGAGYAQGSGIVLQGSISQSNIFGTGKYLSLGVNTGSTSKLYSLSFTDPYYTPDGVSRGFDLYYRDLDPSQLSLGQYQSGSIGTAVRYGVPVTEYDTINFSIGVERDKLTVLSGAADRIVNFADQFGTHYTSLPARVSWVRDARDSSLYPTRGSLRRVDFEASVPGGDLLFYKANLQNQWFYPFSKSLTLLTDAEFGYANGYGGKPLPFFDYYYIGGIGSVRGFQTGSIGKKDSNGDPIGGNRKMLGSLELLFPPPGFPANDKSVRIGAFIDGGGVFAPGDKINGADIRFAAGISLSWVSPVGPLKFSLARALKHQENDKLEAFQFSLGNLF